MDFWSRLIGGAGSSPKKRAIPSRPQLRLSRFKSAYNELLQIWHNGDGVSTDAFAAENARLSLRQLAEMLNDDTRGPTPHLCVAFSATSRLLVVVSRVASAFQDDGITHEALSICGLLIDCEEEAFLHDQGFVEVLPRFARSIAGSSSSRSIDLDIKSELMEVLFGVASRIRIEPELLPKWFNPHAFQPDSIGDHESSGPPELLTRNDQFPLFYLLLQYVPSEGRCGEFARMGLLYIIEIAGHSEDLERWIVEGDMAELLAGGLGALYGQLSRKLALCYPENETPSVLTFSEGTHIIPPADAEETTSAEYQAHLATFLSSLVFWQDILKHCSSKDVTETLLDHFQALFLQQLLYPSLLESSDADGGSSVAVLTYLGHILNSIDHPALLHLILQYLFGERRSPPPETGTSRRPTTLARRRKSQDLLSHMSKVDALPDLYNLADLIMAGLRSESQQTINAALQLISIMLQRHHHRVLSMLLKLETTSRIDECRTIDTQQRDIENLFSMAANLAIFQDIHISYERYLEDSRSGLQYHSCSVGLFGDVSTLDSSKSVVQDELDTYRIKPRSLQSEDPVLKTWMALMVNFFWNDIRTNLSLTQALTDLASCGYTRLEGWLLRDPRSHYSSTHAATHDLLDQEHKESPLSPRQMFVLTQNSQERLVVGSEGNLEGVVEDVSPVFAVLDLLTRQVATFRHEINDFDALLWECNVITATDEDDYDGIVEKIANLKGFVRGSEPIPASPSKAPSQAGLLPGRLRPGRTSASASPSISRTGSPRGRQFDPAAAPTLVKRLDHHPVSPSASPSARSTGHHSPSSFNQKKLTTNPLAASQKRRDGHPIPAALHRKFQVRKMAEHTSAGPFEPPSSETSSVKSDAVGSGTQDEEVKEVTLGHLLTNVIILREFLLELASLVEVRATMLDEVRFV